MRRACLSFKAVLETTEEKNEDLNALSEVLPV